MIIDKSDAGEPEKQRINFLWPKFFFFFTLQHLTRITKC